MIEPARELPADIAYALATAFANDVPKQVTAVSGGLSGAVVLTFLVGEVEYILRRPHATQPEEIARTARGLACLRIAAERGIAPALHHVDEAARIAIMRKISPVIPDRSPDGMARRLERMARTLRRLHDGPRFPQGPGPVAIVRHFDARLRATGGDGIPASLLDAITECTRLTARYAESAPCHNDLNPGNVLETEDAIYLVDWDTAAQSDPFVDLAQVGVFMFPTPPLRDALLRAYLGRAPTAEESARATIARVQALAVYAAAFAHVSASSGASPAIAPEALAMPELLMLLGTERERASPAIVAASLASAMEKAHASDDFRAAKETLEAIAISAP